MAGLSTICQCQQPQIESVIFQQHHSVFTTKSYWLITTIHDFSNYERSLSNIKSNLDKTPLQKPLQMLNRLIGIAKTHNQQEHYKPYIQLFFKMTHNDILHLYSLHRGNNKHFLDLLIVLDPIGSQRSKRALLPIGGFLKSLFGTASNKDLQKIKQAVQDPCQEIK